MVFHHLLYQYSAEIIGGGLIGLAASLLLLCNGRIFGISGIIAGLFQARLLSEFWWRLCVVLGLIASGLVVKFVEHSTLPSVSPDKNWSLTLGGLLVGFGTQLGSGCTSGHGVCGVSRLSSRSIAATLIFMATGIVTVTFLGVE